MLSKFRHLVNKDILLSVYYAIFTHIQLISYQFGLKLNFSLNRVTLLEEKHQDITFRCMQKSYLPSFLQIQNFKIYRPRTIRKLHIKCYIVNKRFNDVAFYLFSNHFKLIASNHSHCTRSVNKGLIFKKLYNTIRYSNKSFSNNIPRLQPH